MAKLEAQAEPGRPAAVSADSAQRPADPGLATWADLLVLLRRGWRLPLAASLGAAGLVAAVLLVRPATYEATATLVATGRGFDSELAPPTLSAEGYQRLLESSSVLTETTERLRVGGVLLDDQALRLGDQVRTRLVAPRPARSATRASLIEVLAVASEPESAAVIANTWSEVFLEAVRQLQEESLSPMIAAIEDRYQQERRRLLELMEEQERLVAEQEAQRAEIASSWDAELAAARRRDEALLAALAADDPDTVALRQALDDRSRYGDQLQRRRAAALAALDESSRLPLARVAADIAQQRLLYARVAATRQEAALVAAQQVLQPIRLVDRAVAPAAPQPRRIGLMVMSAALVGLLLGLVIAFLRAPEPKAKRSRLLRRLPPGGSGSPPRDPTAADGLPLAE